MPEAVHAVPSSPKASRLSRPRWLDPKLLLGVLLVVVAMLIGARAFAAADDTVPVWRVRADMATGDPVTPASLVATRVRFTDDTVAGSYVSAARPLPAGQVAARNLHGGEMLAQSAVRPAGAVPTVEVPIPVPAAQLGLVAANSRVDVIVTPPRNAANAPGLPVQVLTNVPVTQVPDTSAGAFSAGGGTSVAVVVRVDPVTQKGFDPVRLAGQLSSGDVFLVRHEGRPEL